MNYKAAIEAILFTMGESVELGRIADAIQLNEKETKNPAVNAGYAEKDISVNAEIARDNEAHHVFVNYLKNL